MPSSSRRPVGPPPAFKMLPRWAARGIAALRSRPFRRLRPRLRPVALPVLLAACGGGGGDARAPADRPAERDTVVVFAAASLVRPLRPLLDTLHARTGAVVQLESGGSLEHARKLTELGRVPDLLFLADHEVFGALLVPEHVASYLQFARNRLVLAYTDRSHGAREVTAANWRAIVTRPGVEVGRSDPDRAPAGYRTLLLLQLAERHYRDPGLAARVLARSPARNVRANAAELAALLEVGELDYVFDYESLARAHDFRWIALPPEIDLGDPTRAALYATARVRVAGRTPRDSLTVAGAPILYGAAIPRRAPHPAAAQRALDFILGEEGRAMLRAGGVDVLERPVRVGGS